MRFLYKKIKWLIFSTLLCLLFTSCEDYDPYKNPKPPSKQREHKNPIEIPSIPSCSRRQPQTPPNGGGGGGGGGGFGCSRHIDTIKRQPRHKRERPQREVEDPNGPIYPCPDHIFPFCTDENPYGVTYKSGTRGYAAYPRSRDLGCLTIAPCPVWYYMQIDQPGDLLIYIEQKSWLKKLDVDFACWGPFEAESKRDFLDKICNSFYQLNVNENPSHRPANGDHRNDMGNYPEGNLVDCSFDRAGTEWCFIPEAKTGEWYLLLLTNYSKKKGTIHFERVNSMSTATTNCNVVIPVSIIPLPKGLKQIDDRTSAICLYEDMALVVVEIETDNGYSLPRHSLRQAQVEVHADGRIYRAILKNGHFECEIDIENDTTVYYATISCPDPEFDLDTEKHYIVRTTDCSPDDVEYTQCNPYHAGDQSFVDIVKGDGSVGIDFTDLSGVVRGSHGDGMGIDAGDYDIWVDYDDLFIEKVDMTKDDKGIKFSPKVRGDWCECFVPDTLTFYIRMVPSNGDVHALPYLIPIKIGILHQTVWIGRCLWALITVGILVLMIIYLILLMKKNRFKKCAMMMAIYYDRYGSEVDDQGGQPLRKPGFGAWLARWFWPRDERNTLTFDTPSVAGLHLIAASSDAVVLVDKSSVDKNTMQMDGYDPENDKTPNQPAKLGSNGNITVTRTDGTRDGYLVFMPGNERDGGGFRMMLGIAIFIDFVAILTLAIFIIRGLL